MKNIVIQPTVQLENQERQESMIMEASINGNVQKRNFTAADMWNRNRRVRSAGSMVRRWHLS